MRVKERHKRQIKENQKLNNIHCGNEICVKQEIKWNPQLSADDLSLVEEAIMRLVQQKYYGDEMTALSSGTMKKPSYLYRYKLYPVVADGVLRVGGSLSKSALLKKQNILQFCQKSTSNLILQHIHEKVGHRGRNHMLSTLRHHYWIPHVNVSARKVIRVCMVCQQQWQMADSCINAIRRFICCRGQVKEIWSDNGKNYVSYVSSSHELKQAISELNES